MLRSFRLANHRSFLEEQELLLMPSAPGRGGEVLTVAAIYGANASGKSNLLDGLRFMSRAVTDSFQRWDADGGVPRRPFRLTSEGRSRPSTFVVEIVIDDVPHTYGFSVDDDRFTEEWLYAYPEKRKRVLFERTGNEIKFGTTVGQLKPKLELLEQLTRSNALFLSVAAQSNLDPLISVYHWFLRSTYFRVELTHPRSVLLFKWQVADYLDDAVLGRKLRELLAAADTGITDLLVEEEKATDRHALPRSGAVGPELKFVHGVAEEPFGIDDESDGTRKWLELLVPVLAVLEYGGTLLVDEIDSSLHPLLTVKLLDMFASMELNPRRAQLIFTTHDTTPLGSYVGRDVLHRDQVWFVEKDARGQSKLYPLSDFKPRIGENAEKRYLGGSYGAIPVLSDLDFEHSVRPE